MKNKAAVLTLICFGAILISMFLPFYEGPETNRFVSKDSFSVIEIYDSPDFGLRMWVFNGFGSLFAWVNLAMGCVFVLSRFFFPKSLLTAILNACVFIISLILLMASTSDKIQTAPLADEMLSGFYLMLVSQVVLIAQSFTKAVTEAPKDRRQNTDLLDF